VQRKTLFVLEVVVELGELCKALEVALAIRLVPLMQVHQHGLLEFYLAVTHHDSVIMLIQTADGRLYWRFVDMSDA
jgi:hypothetical protein